MTRANLQLTDYDAEGRPRVEDLELISAPLSALLTMELDGAAEVLELTTDDILLAALGRAIERTIGTGVVGVDVPSYGTSVEPVALSCAAPAQLDADEMLAGVHHQLGAVAVHGIVRGVPSQTRAASPSAVLFATAAAAAERPHTGHVLELRAFRQGDVIALDWWFDARSFEPYTVAELADQFPLAMIELTSEAIPPVHANNELALAH
ncbi:hypothetical protein CIW49_07230 [Mycolicibacterium sp. P1-18]|uniref:hypothetical protein n=1 Tax=Mycolicibacterium sp. P1-18 TaxID=2024615 RepID=UPI0011F20D4E|nr:hypothetical protein [Mycolicibacterium sp. P1-18]KAA0101264.1 hypothetical protein CIW49_07230 [Mycolicibacterium sp. P1-18]